VDNWPWRFEIFKNKVETPTLTTTRGLDDNNHRRRNDWIGELVKPKYPVYILSKDRANIDKTWRVLNLMEISHTVVVEAEQYDQYAESLKPYKKYSTVFALPKDFRETYRGESEDSGGGIPARNFIWEHSIKQGAKRHWVMDDNLHCFQRLHRGEKQRLCTGAGFKALEDFVDRYTNVAIAGPQYIFFCPAKQTKVPYRLNTRVYSCILIKNDIPYRWRGRYNEDTDLSIRALKDGWCTVLSNAFLVDKTTTMRDKGGNTTALYGVEGAHSRSSDTDGREKMADSLVAQHPDIVQKVRKFHRWHHSVNYRGVKKNALVKVDPQARERVSDYGMRQLVEV
jgi:hypothetical protein